MSAPTYYEYVHRPGYGASDHMADGIIARAARQLGAQGADKYIAAFAGLASHPVPMPRSTYRVSFVDGAVEVEGDRGVRAAMERALRDAKAEVPRACRDVRIDVVCRRRRTVVTGTRLEQVTCGRYRDGFGRWRTDRYEDVPVYETLVEERRGREWVQI